MKRLAKLVVFLVMIGGWPLALSAIHVVRTPGQLPVVGSMVPNLGNVQIFTKEKLGFRQTFADTRKWTPDDVINRSELVARMTAVGLGDLAKPNLTPDAATPAVAPTPVEKPPLSLPAGGVPWDVSKPVKLVTPETHSSPATKPMAQKDDSIFNFGR